MLDSAKSHWKTQETMVNMKQNSFQQGVDSVPRGRRGRDRMVVGFTTTYAIGVYHHWCCEFELDQGEVYNIMW